ncbi:MAG: O-antigen ligase family protein [Gammaproteobacteria bacterium]
MTETKRYLLLFAIMILGIPFAYHRRVAFEAIFLAYLSNVLFFIILVSQIDSLKRLKSLLVIICLSAFLYSFFGFYYGTFLGGRFAIYGAMFDPNDIAYVLISLCPLCIFFLQSGGLLKKVVSIVTICSSITVILLTGSRGGMVGMLAVLAFMLLTKTEGIKFRHKIFLLCVLAVVGILLGDKINVERYLTLTDLQSDYNAYDEFGRMEIWKHGIALALEHPLTGVGVDCFGMALGFRRDELGLLPKWQAPHNSFVQVAAEIGLVGFAVFTLISVRTLRTFWRASRIEFESAETREIRMLGSVMLLGFVGHLASAFFLTQGWSVFFTLFFALAAVVQRLQALPAVCDASNQSNVRVSRRMPLKRISRIRHV